MKEVIIHSEARLEALHEEAYYESRDEGLGGEFQTALTEALETVKQHPRQSRRRLGPCRRLFLERFPFSVVYEEFEDRIWVYAVMHHKRRPFYWLHRRTKSEDT